MHFRNGREAKNGDQVIKLEGGRIVAFGTLKNAVPGEDYCNGDIEPITNDQMACMVDCLHVDDIAALLAKEGLDARPSGK